jgi:peptidoglycan L-alanyl-D-glutamate endopeptidase CwlK
VTRAEYNALSSLRLKGVHPTLVEKVWRLIAALDALGFPIFVTSGVRTTEQQQALYAKGRTVPGKVVTNADGVIKKSNHQAKDDGFGHAVDCAFMPSDVSREPFSDLHPWTAYGACAAALGLSWGGAWKSINDQPHVELRG